MTAHNHILESFEIKFIMEPEKESGDGNHTQISVKEPLVKRTVNTPTHFVTLKQKSNPIPRTKATSGGGGTRVGGGLGSVQDSGDRKSGSELLEMAVVARKRNRAPSLPAADFGDTSSSNVATVATATSTAQKSKQKGSGNTASMSPKAVVLDAAESNETTLKTISYRNLKVTQDQSTGCSFLNSYRVLCVVAMPLPETGPYAAGRTPLVRQRTTYRVYDPSSLYHDRSLPSYTESHPWVSRRYTSPWVGPLPGDHEEPMSELRI